MDYKIKNLAVQYDNAMGYLSVDYSLKSNRERFKNWLIERDKMSKEYLKFLDYIGFPEVILKTTCEVGKCKYDSIVYPYETKFITPYMDYKDICENRLYKAKLLVENNQILLLNNNVRRKFQLSRLSNMGINTFITQNPYSIEDINGWEDIHNSDDYGIVVGIYGSRLDKDFGDKLKLLSILKTRLDKNIEVDYFKANDMYAYVLASKKVLKKYN